ncbi:MAG: response regulator [Gammaproteobacteria bacterium]|nr:response regulator [Gammaproteobacteria bacterium]
MNEQQANTRAVWVIDDDQSIRWVLERALSNAGFVVSVFETASTALSQFKRAEIKNRPSLLLTDFRMPGINGFELLKQVKNIDPALPVIIMTAYSDLDTTVQAYQNGSFEYLAKPFDIDDAIALVTNACQPQTEAKPCDPGIPHLESSTDWQAALQLWADGALIAGKTGILTEATDEFEKILIECALRASKGRKQKAAKLLGWGRNTLTRKLKQHS